MTAYIEYLAIKLDSIWQEIKELWTNMFRQMKICTDKNKDTE
jgi:hypothetical protein